MGVRVKRHAPAVLPPGKRLVTYFQEAGWDPRPVWTGVENFAPNGIRSPDRPTRSESLYRVGYPGHLPQGVINNNNNNNSYH
jgi:hypothetical protein